MFNNLLGYGVIGARRKFMFAVLDLKCQDIAAVAVGWNKKGTTIIPDSFVIIKSKGIHRGVITDLAEAADSIAEAISRLKDLTGEKIKDVYVAMSPRSVEITPSRGMILLSKYGRTVLAKDVEKCVEMAAFVKLPQGKEVLHTLTKEFAVDNEKGIINPVGLDGVKLSADVNILAVDSSAVRNISKCVALSGCNIFGIIFSGIAYANRILSDTDSLKTVAILNMCADSVEVSIFEKKKIIFTKIIETGIINFLTRTGIRGEVLRNFAEDLKAISVWPNVEEIIVTGDASLYEDILEPLEQITKIPAKFGVCQIRTSEELPSQRLGYIGCLGMIDYIASESLVSRAKGNFISWGYFKISKFLDRYF
ncbi:cell division protein FtsA [Candidatus Omnitrophus magneticus]|uniref:Cell division protein FtsA n=1 Tax=Candidatus Omnitrophus magneticus TaxID=1609969 RepID=A0A0F0CWJ8_9BACT|nr:cell division protein FtsA [Candidatus Omnitrophus magneticus]KJJ85810.1 cell division protein FtsA [Candidatus Omnitrophus magneticus]